MTAPRFLSEEQIRRRAEQRLNQRKELNIHIAVYVLINTLIWLGWSFGSTFIGDPDIEGLPVPLIPLLGWGAGLAAHWLVVYHNSGARVEARERAIREAMREHYGDDWNEMASTDEYNRTRARVEKHYNQRAEFSIHAAVFVIINALLWVVWSFAGGFIGDTEIASLPFPLIPMIGWGAGLAAHGISVYGAGRSATSREQALEQEMERERRMLYGEAEKVKRKNSSRLMQTADDETLEVVDVEDDAPIRMSKRG